MIYLASRMWKEGLLGSDLLRLTLNGTLPYTQLYDRMPVQLQRDLRKYRQLYRSGIPCRLGLRRVPEWKVGRKDVTTNWLPGVPWSSAVEDIGMWLSTELQLQVPSPNIHLMVRRMSHSMGVPKTIVMFIQHSIDKMFKWQRNHGTRTNQKNKPNGQRKKKKIPSKQKVIQNRNKKRKGNQTTQNNDSSSEEDDSSDDDSSDDDSESEQENEPNDSDDDPYSTCRAFLTSGITFDSTFLVFYILSAIELYPNWEQWAMTHLPRNDREASFLEFAKTRKEPRKRSGTRKQGLLSWNTDRPIPTRVSEAQLLCRDSLRQYLLYCNRHVFIGPQEDRY